MHAVPIPAKRNSLAPGNSFGRNRPSGSIRPSQNPRCCEFFLQVRKGQSGVSTFCADRRVKFPTRLSVGRTRSCREDTNASNATRRAHSNGRSQGRFLGDETLSCLGEQVVDPYPGYGSGCDLAGGLTSAACGLNALSRTPITQTASRGALPHVRRSDVIGGPVACEIDAASALGADAASFRSRIVFCGFLRLFRTDGMRNPNFPDGRAASAARAAMRHPVARRRELSVQYLPSQFANSVRKKLLVSETPPLR